MSTKVNKSQIVENWKEVLDDSSVAKPLTSNYKRYVTAQLMENAHNAKISGEMESASQVLGGVLNEDAPQNNTAYVQNYDPVLISMLRRNAPNMVGFDIMGVIPLTGPTGTVFALRSRYGGNTGPEAFYNEANTGHSTITGNTTALGDAAGNVGVDVSGNSAIYNFASAMTTIQGEALGSPGNTEIAKMSITIEKFNVSAETRALQAEYTQEMAQDLKAIHGLDAEKELANVLATELLAEINRDAIRTAVLTAVPGSPTSLGVTTAGTFDLDTDSNGRWMAERFAGLHFHITREANAIAKQTRRGRGNIMLCSSDVASALEMAKIIQVNDAAGLQVDDTGNVFAGTIGGRIKVYIDPYAGRDFMVIGYKGSHAWDAGLFYCPYTPLQLTKGQSENGYQPKMAFKTRYAMAANPFSGGATASNGQLIANSNVYYRRTLINNLM